MVSERLPIIQANEITRIPAARAIDVRTLAAPYPPISNYGIIGNCRTAALVSASGSIDWLCLPRFDGKAMFSAILDAEKGGRFSITPREIINVERTYLGNSNVLATTFTTRSGIMRLIDLMPVHAESEKKRILVPRHEILRKLECLEGEVVVDVRYEPRPAYGSAVPRIEDRKRNGWLHQHDNHASTLRSDMPLKRRNDRSAVDGMETLHEGEERWVSMTYTEMEPAILPPLGGHAEERLRHSIDWWEQWAGNCKYDGPYRAIVLRSSLALKLLDFAPSGAIVAAPTTSLPEWIGGVRNWDYRYCWLRDASLTVRALLDLGFETEASSFLAWVLDATWTTQPELQVLYDVFGETHVPERELHNLEGYRKSSPVRIGNDARNQLQMDIYGEVILAVHEDLLRGGRIGRAEQALLRGIGDLVCKRWREPDEGIWEIRAGRRHHTYSKAMCWVALDRLLRMHEGKYLNVDAPRLQRERDAIRDEIEKHGYHEGVGSYVSEFGGETLDASLLLLGVSGYADPASPRMQSTVDAILRALGKNGLLYRYASGRDGLPGGEGAFGICALWAVQCLALGGRYNEAVKQFEHFLAYANDLGLFSEEIDPDSGMQLGNFPQAFTHLGVIDTALMLASAEKRSKAPGKVTGNVNGE